MILHGEDAVMAWRFLGDPNMAGPGRRIVAYHDGQRYGGFRSEAQAAWTMHKAGIYDFTLGVVDVDEATGVVKGE